jgi:hypothetical protein
LVFALGDEKWADRSDDIGQTSAEECLLILSKTGVSTPYSPSKLVSIFAGRLSGFALEKDAHVFRVFEPRKFRNMFQREIRLHQELFNPLDFYTPHFLLR